MTVKSILVPLTGSPNDSVSLATAFVVAKQFGGHVDAVLAQPSPEEVVYAADLYESIEARKVLAEQVRNAAKLAFASAAKQADAATEPSRTAKNITASYRTETGLMPSIVGAASLFADLVVFPPLRLADHSTLQDAFVEVLMRAQCPVLLCAQSAPERVGSKIAAGWDDGLPAAHALVSAIPFLEKSGAVQLLAVRRGLGHDFDIAEVTEYLGLHGVDVRYQDISSGSHQTGEQLLAAAAGQGCDLLVVGGYGHSRTLETVFGGVTDYIASHSTIPVLMAH